MNKNKLKTISILLLLSMLTALTACSKPEDELYGFYLDDDNVISTDIGEYIIGQTSELFTEGRLCYIPVDPMDEDENLKNKATIVISLTDNEPVFLQNIYKKVYPASITKLLTALVIFKYGNLDDIYTIKEDNCGITESGAQLMGFKAGDKINVKDLLFCLLLYSGNDAAAALADYYCGDESAFCDIMNREAERLGCIDTHYTNPHGLHDDDHYTTAYDEYVILRECLDFELFRTIAQTAEYEFSYQDAEGQYKNMSVATTNRFKKGMYEIPKGMNIIGGKTGNTFAAGTCLIQCVENAEGEEYIIGIFGAENNEALYTQMQYLMRKVAGESTEPAPDPEEPTEPEA